MFFASALSCVAVNSPDAFARTKPKARAPAAQAVHFDPIKWSDQPTAQPMDILSVDAKGNAKALPWQTQVSSVWTDGVPALRLWIQVPSEFSKAETSKNLPAMTESGYSFVEQPQGAPFSGSSKTFAVDLISGTELKPVPIHLTGKGDKVVELSLVVSPDLDHPAYFLGESCASLGIKATTLKVGAHFLFAAASCSVQENGRILVHLFHSKEGQWTKLPKTAVEKQKDGSVVLFFEKSKTGAGSPASAVSISIKDRAAGGVSEFRFERVEEAPVKRAGLVVGLGVSELNYLEPGQGVHLLETGLTGKVTGYYLLKPQVFDTSVNAFFTLLPLIHSPSSIVASRFYGANVRVGWQLPGKPAGLTFTLSGGWYFWGMLVPGSAYGVSFLGGPEVFLSLRGNLTDGRTYGTYFKYAPISQGFSPAIGNRELAVGGAYPISKAGVSHPLSLTLDIADVVYVSPDGLNSLRLTSASLGVQMGF